MNQGGKKICQHNQKMDKRIEKSLHRKERVANKHIKRCLISRVIREMQSKTSTRYNCTSNRLAKLKKKKSVNTRDEQSGKTRHLYCSGKTLLLPNKI